MNREVVGLFPVPLARVRGALEPALIAGLIERFAARAEQTNVRSDKLAHTTLLAPAGEPLLREAIDALVPHVAALGELLLGEPLPWALKELWINVLEPGGAQALHNHANSLVSGIVYLTGSDPSACTVFSKSPGGTDFTFRNDNARARLGPYNADKWVAPSPAPGDLLLFPSYLLHEVPENKGTRRISLAFNAIPARLDAWGYTLTLGR